MACSEGCARSIYTAHKKEREHLLLLIPIQECTQQILAPTTWRAQRVARGLLTQLKKKETEHLLLLTPIQECTKQNLALTTWRA
jgi:hypothetical protein